MPIRDKTLYNNVQCAYIIYMAAHNEPENTMWTKSTTTKHTCGGPVFGKKTPGCPRCDELIEGAKPVQWKISNDQQRISDIRSHNCKTAGCGPVCTHGDW